jgi:hypothetical protein
MLVVAEDFRERITEDRAGLIETYFMLLEVAFRFVVIPFEPDTHQDSFRVKIDPQGKPAGYRSIPIVRDGADVALLIPGKDLMVAHFFSARAWESRFSSFLSQAKFSKEVLRKEVIQPQVPLRLPCYDLVPITGFIFGACLAAPTTSDAPRFGGLTGGVYKAQEHIHRRSADRRLLAIPASCGRVAARNPNWGTIFAIGAALRPGNALSVPL